MDSHNKNPDCAKCGNPGEHTWAMGGDLLIVAGDLTATGCLHQLLFFRCWMKDQNYRKKIFIAGNNDRLLENPHVYQFRDDVEYLCDSGTEFEGLKIWGSPWVKSFPGMNPHCKAFTVDTEEELSEKWALIPDDVEILITHSPPEDILDELVEEGKHAGSISLFNRLMKIRPPLHVFGHIHEAYGRQDIEIRSKEMNIFVNASHVNENYEPVNKPIRIELLI